MRKPVLVFLWLLICTPHMNFSKLFIFLTSPYGAVTCLSWSTVEKCKSESGLLLVCVHGRPSSNNAWFYFFYGVSCVDAILCNTAQEVSSTWVERDNECNRPKMWRCYKERRCFWSAVDGVTEKAQKKKRLLIFFEMPQLIAMRCPKCADD